MELSTPASRHFKTDAVNMQWMWPNLSSRPLALVLILPSSTGKKRRVQAWKYTHPDPRFPTGLRRYVKRAHSSCGECVKPEEPQRFAFWQPLCFRIDDRLNGLDSEVRLATLTLATD